MSVDVTVIVFGTHTPAEVLDVAGREGLGATDGAADFRCAGFWFEARPGGNYDAEEVEEARRDGWYKPHMDRPQVRLCCSTNMGWSWRGSTRRMQFPVAHLIAQTLAMAMNAEAAVHDPQGGTVVYYRRTDRPEAHAALDGTASGFAMECPNFCETRTGDGPWRPVDPYARQETR
jgi:hypothetical protein